MGAYERRKGQAGERELFSILRDRYGLEVQRNLDQTRQGGGDSDRPVLGYTIETKRWAKRTHLYAAIQQVQKAAAEMGTKPVVMFRLDRQDWEVIVPMTLDEWVERARKEEGHD